MRSSGYIFKAGQKAPPPRARQPTRDTRWAGAVEEPQRPSEPHGVGLFAHG